jgi:cation diffusion facilitator CzcD-associated flavoprotein CzcO
LTLDSVETFDVLIVGAGLSGIAAAVKLRQQFPDKRIAILEGRDALGGTWDLFRYPGVRSDSDMSTYGFSFRPWQGERTVAEGAEILQYLRDTAAEHGIASSIRYGHRVVRAAWRSEDARWTLHVECGGSDAPLQLAANFLFVCGGYYRYDGGFVPAFEGMADFEGRVVHPQAWTPDIATANKRVLVIGSGATAITLVPALAQQSAHVTMLQRSPTYVVALPTKDRVAQALRRVLPRTVAAPLTRWKNLLASLAFVELSKRFPERIKSWLVERARRALPAGYDVATHFTPAYRPWTQRMCPAPDGDFFDAIRGGRASVVTGEIERFTREGVLLKSGQTVAADIVVTATGFDLQLLGGIALEVDGQAMPLNKTWSYQGVMLSGVPNLATVFGYAAGAWTLKAELVCDYVVRLLRHMERRGERIAVPRLRDPSTVGTTRLDFSPGYVLRALKGFPRLGAATPWFAHQNYLRDRVALRHRPIADGVLEFAR